MSAAVESVVFQIRGPRVLAAVAVGAALAVAGAAFQGLFRNPLVSPDILGASAGSALGAVLGIFLSFGIFGIQAAAFAGGLVAVGLVYVRAGAFGAPGRPRCWPLLLTGLVIGALLGAGIGLVKYLADPYNQLPAMTFWLLGSLAGVNAADLGPLLGPVALGTAVLLALRWQMNVMSPARRGSPRPGRADHRAAPGHRRRRHAGDGGQRGRGRHRPAGWGWWCRICARLLVGPSFPSGCCRCRALLGRGLPALHRHPSRARRRRWRFRWGILTAVIGTPFFIAVLRPTLSPQPGRLGLNMAALAAGAGPGPWATPATPWAAASRWPLQPGEVLALLGPQWRRQDHAAEDAARA